MLTRLELQETLKDILGSDQVYYEPPETVKMHYPAIVYSLARMHNRAADNFTVYMRYDSYTVMYIDPTPQTTRTGTPLEKILALDGCVFDRTYVMDNLHHYVFTIYLS